MKSQNQHLLIICTPFNDWTAPYFRSFNINLTAVPNDTVKAISFNHCANDLDNEPLFYEFDILVFNEDIAPDRYETGYLSRLIAEKDSVYLVVHRLHIREFLKMIGSIAQNKLNPYRKEKSFDSHTTDMLKRLAEAFKQRNEENYYKVLRDFFQGRNQDDQLEMKLHLLNLYDLPKFQDLSARLSRHQNLDLSIRKLLDRYPTLAALIEEMAQAKNGQDIKRIRLELAKLFFPPWNKGW